MLLLSLRRAQQIWIAPDRFRRIEILDTIYINLKLHFLFKERNIYLLLLEIPAKILNKSKHNKYY